MMRPGMSFEEAVEEQKRRDAAERAAAKPIQAGVAAGGNRWRVCCATRRGKAVPHLPTCQDRVTAANRAAARDAAARVRDVRKRRELWWGTPRNAPVLDDRARGRVLHLVRAAAEPDGTLLTLCQMRATLPAGKVSAEARRICTNCLGLEARGVR